MSIDLTTLPRLCRSKGLDPLKRKMWRAFQKQVASTKTRHIPFLFTFEEWCAWWLKDDRWDRRGRGRDRLVMARRGGSYHPRYVVCVTNAENARYWDDDRLLKARQSHAKRLAAGTHHLQVRGAGHPCSRTVRTPAGVFGSAALAAEAFGISRQQAARLARKKQDGWSYFV